MSKYVETIDFLYSQLPIYQRVGVAAYKEDLENTEVLDQMFDHPHRAFKTIHVGGTNGKGSTAHMITSILMESGYKVGLYTSPHLRDFRERIRVNGEMITKDAVVAFVDTFCERNKTSELGPSFFELTVAMAFNYFKEQNVDYAVIEVGLGGRLDSTNIINPELSVITNIGLDHTHLLGDTYEKVAAEKAGIIKKSTPVIVGEYDERTAPIFKSKSNEVQAPLHFADALFTVQVTSDFKLFIDGPLKIPSIEMDLKGKYQQRNVKTALSAILELNKQGLQIKESDIVKGLSKVSDNTGLLGRWQKLSEDPLTICDTGHNKEGVSLIVEQLSTLKYRTLHIVFGVVEDKNLDGVMQLLPKDAQYYFTQANISRALDVFKLKEIAQNYGLKGKAFQSVSEAKQAAEENATPQDVLFIGGSTFVVAEVV